MQTCPCGPAPDGDSSQSDPSPLLTLTYTVAPEEYPSSPPTSKHCKFRAGQKGTRTVWNRLQMLLRFMVVSDFFYSLSRWDAFILLYKGNDGQAGAAQRNGPRNAARCPACQETPRVRWLRELDPQRRDPARLRSRGVGCSCRSAPVD